MNAVCYIQSDHIQTYPQFGSLNSKHQAHNLEVKTSKVYHQQIMRLEGEDWKCLNSYVRSYMITITSKLSAEAIQISLL